MTLYQAGTRVSVINPAHSKHFAKSLGIGTKNDRSDAKVLAQYGLKMQDSLRLWQPPSPAYQALRYLESRKYALQKDLQREQNRLEKHLSKAGLSQIRRKLYMVATRFNPVIKDFYNRLVQKAKAKKHALLASMRTLVHLCFGVLKTQTPFSINHA